MKILLTLFSANHLHINMVLGEDGIEMHVHDDGACPCMLHASFQSSRETDQAFDPESYAKKLREELNDLGVKKMVCHAHRRPYHEYRLGGGGTEGSLDCIMGCGAFFNAPGLLEWKFKV